MTQGQPKTLEQLGERRMICAILQATEDNEQTRDEVMARQLSRGWVDLEWRWVEGRSYLVGFFRPWEE